MSKCKKKRKKGKEVSFQQELILIHLTLAKVVRSDLTTQGLEVLYKNIIIIILIAHDFMRLLSLMYRCMSRILLQDWSLLTFLKTAGFGRGGPKAGTSSLAVTDTCSHQINNSQILLVFILGRFRFQTGRVRQNWRETWERIVIASGEWFIRGFVMFLCVDPVIRMWS